MSIDHVFNVIVMHFFQMLQCIYAVWRCWHVGRSPAASQINISLEHEAAIGKLEQLGFDRVLCIEAFLIYAKNEEVAAN